MEPSSKAQRVHLQHTVSVLKAWGLFQKRSREIVRGRGAESLLSDFCLLEMSEATAHKVSPAQPSKHELNKDINRHVQVEGQKPTSLSLIQGVPGNYKRWGVRNIK